MAIPVDSRFPNLIRVSDTPDHVRRIAAPVARQVCNRANVAALYNTDTGGLYFHLHDDIRRGLPIQCPIEDDGHLNRPTPSDIDDMVKLIGMGRMPAAEKDRISDANKRAEDSRAQKDIETSLAERRPDALSRAEHLRVKRQMGKHFRKGVVVDGLKGA